MFFIVGCTKPSDPVTWDTCSQRVGKHPCNFTLKDQNGDDWTLYYEYGTPILIEFSAEWCYWCHQASQGIAQLKESYNFTHVTILLESRTGEPADQQLAKKWADTFRIDDPVLHGWENKPVWPMSALPSFYMISDKMIITQKFEGWNFQATEYFIKEEQKK